MTGKKGVYVHLNHAISEKRILFTSFSQIAGVLAEDVT